MKANAALVSLAGLTALTSVAHASVITYVLSLNDNGAGVATTGRYAVYAYSSAGDNAGFASFGVTLTNLTTATNRSPQANYTDQVGVYDPGTDTTSYGADKTAGFTFLRTDGADSVEATGSFDTIVNLAGQGNGLAKYGIGQTAGTLASGVAAPANYAYTVKNGYTPTYGVTNTFTSGTVLTNTGGEVPFVVLSGTFTGTPAFGLVEGNLFTGSGLTASTPTTITTVTRTLSATPEPASLAALGLIGGSLLVRRRKTA